MIEEGRSSRAFLTQNSALITNLNANFENSKKPHQSIDPDKQTTEKVALWGDDNLYPQWVMDQTKDVTLVRPILAWKAEALYGGGLSYGLERYENGKEIIEPLIDPEIEDWCENSNIDQYLLEAPANYYHFYNIFPGMVQSLDGSRINFLHCHESTDTRWEKRSPRGFIENAYISPDWERYGADTKETKRLKVIDHYRHTIDDIKAVGNKELIYPIAFPSPGRGYYQEAPWHVLLKSWLPIARAIPEYKASILTSQLSIRYIIEVPEWYWQQRYPDWAKLTADKRKEIVAEEHKKFDEFFTGKEKGKSMMVDALNAMQGQQKAAWKITELNKPLAESAFIEDSQEADAHIFKNMAVNPTLFGNTAGKDLSGGGSGSNARVAWNTYQLITKPHQMQILKPLQYIARYNGWQQRLQKPGTKLRFWFKNYMIARLDEGAETKPDNNKSE